MSERSYSVKDPKKYDRALWFAASVPSYAKLTWTLAGLDTSRFGNQCETKDST